MLNKTSLFTSLLLINTIALAMETTSSTMVSCTDVCVQSKEEQSSKKIRLLRDTPQDRLYQDHLLFIYPCIQRCNQIIKDNEPLLAIGKECDERSRGFLADQLRREFPPFYPTIYNLWGYLQPEESEFNKQLSKQSSILITRSVDEAIRYYSPTYAAHLHIKPLAEKLRSKIEWLEERKKNLQKNINAMPQQSTQEKEEKERCNKYLKEMFEDLEDFKAAQKRLAVMSEATAIHQEPLIMREDTSITDLTHKTRYYITQVIHYPFMIAALRNLNDKLSRARLTLDAVIQAVILSARKQHFDEYLQEEAIPVIMQTSIKNLLKKYGASQFELPVYIEIATPRPPEEFFFKFARKLSADNSASDNMVKSHTPRPITSQTVHWQNMNSSPLTTNASARPSHRRQPSVYPPGDPDADKENVQLSSSGSVIESSGSNNAQAGALLQLRSASDSNITSTDILAKAVNAMNNDDLQTICSKTSLVSRSGQGSSTDISQKNATTTNNNSQDQVPLTASEAHVAVTEQ